MIFPDFRDIKRQPVILSHSAKGTTWKNHKYIKVENGRYFYPKSNNQGGINAHGKKRNNWILNNVVSKQNGVRLRYEIGNWLEDHGFDDWFEDLSGDELRDLQSKLINAYSRNLISDRDMERANGKAAIYELLDMANTAKLASYNKEDKKAVPNTRNGLTKSSARALTEKYVSKNDKKGQVSNRNNRWDPRTDREWRRKSKLMSQKYKAR